MKYKSIPVSIKDKIEFIVYNRKVPDELVDYIIRYFKLEDKVNRILDSIIISNNIDYKSTRKDFIKISKLLKEMESMSNELNARKIKRNSDIKS